MKLIRVFLTAVIYLLFIPSSLQAQPAAAETHHQQDDSKKVSKKRAAKEKRVASSAEKTQPQAQASSSKIDLNQATVAVLSKSIHGIGVKRAEAIVNYRMKHGQFKSFEELSQIKGLGKKFVKEHFKELEKCFTLG